MGGRTLSCFAVLSYQTCNCLFLKSILVASQWWALWKNKLNIWWIWVLNQVMATAKSTSKRLVQEISSADNQVFFFPSLTYIWVSKHILAQTSLIARLGIYEFLNHALSDMMRTDGLIVHREKLGRQMVTPKISLWCLTEWKWNVFQLIHRIYFTM